MTCGDYGGVTVKGLPCKRKAGWGVADADEGRCVTHLEVVEPDPVEPDPIIVDPVEPEEPYDPIVTVGIEGYFYAGMTPSSMSVHLRLHYADADGNPLPEMDTDVEGVVVIE
jgi:hypothetical protein